MIDDRYDDVIMNTMASKITSLTIVYSIVYSGVDQRKHQSSASLAFVSGIHRWPVNSPHNGPVTLKVFPFDDVIMRIIMQTVMDIHLLYRIYVTWIFRQWCILRISLKCISNDQINAKLALVQKLTLVIVQLLFSEGNTFAKYKQLGQRLNEGSLEVMV